MLTAADPQPGAYSITGPEALSVREQVQILSDVLGRSYTVREISQAQAATAAFPAGTPDVVATSVLETMGPAAAVLAAGTGVQSLTGNPPRRFRAWVGDNATAFA